ncbi:MAG: hypothetical protein QOD00_1689 [Blastocatellia bacterium]|jgi:hypothetical protein|nr:hypothetical protein [Blastocatellia bacterium]
MIEAPNLDRLKEAIERLGLDNPIVRNALTLRSERITWEQAIMLAVYYLAHENKIQFEELVKLSTRLPLDFSDMRIDAESDKTFTQ